MSHDKSTAKPCMADNWKKHSIDSLILLHDFTFISPERRIIRTYHECEDGIEKTVPRIIDWHHSAFRVMSIYDREGRILGDDILIS